ncbi:MAG: TauD/TfdA family dioxygenase [Rhodospirillales bacterium]
MKPALSPADRWLASGVAGKSGFTVPLGDRLTLIEQALARLKDADINDPSFGRSAEITGPLRQVFAPVRDSLMDGRGVVILTGIPVDRWPVDYSARAFRLIGSCFGHGVSQSRLGDRLGHVTDVSGTNPNERGYRTSRELRLHTDANDLVGLLCVRQARDGGLSRLTNALAVHDAMQQQAPDLLAELYRGFPYHWRGEQPPGEPEITGYRVPVFSEHQGRVSCVYLREHITWAAEEGHPLTDRQQAALALFDELADSTGHCLHFALEPGEALFFNNLTTLHARTAYDDWDEPERKRLLLRLWLRADNARPVVAEVDRFYPADGIAMEEGASTIYERKSARL